MCAAEGPRAFVRRDSRSEEAALCCGTDLGVALSARPGGFGRRDWTSGRPGTLTAPLCLGLSEAREAPLPLLAGCPRTRKAPFPARPGPRPSDALVLAGQRLPPHPLSPSLLWPADSGRSFAPLPSATVPLDLGISASFSPGTSISHFASCRHLKG